MLEIKKRRDKDYLNTDVPFSELAPPETEEECKWMEQRCKIEEEEGRFDPDEDGDHSWNIDPDDDGIEEQLPDTGYVYNEDTGQWVETPTSKIINASYKKG